MLVQWSIIISMDAFKWCFPSLIFPSISEGKLLKRNEGGYVQLLRGPLAHARYDVRCV